MSYRGKDDMVEEEVRVMEEVVTYSNIVEEAMEKVEVEIYIHMEKVVKVKEVVVTYKYMTEDVMEMVEEGICKHMV